jgi:hypothetical protein
LTAASTAPLFLGVVVLVLGFAAALGGNHRERAAA